MLVWEEDVRPSTQQKASLAQRPLSPASFEVTHDTGPQASLAKPVLSDAATSASAATPAPLRTAIASSAVPAVARRVNAADKRIINGQTDRKSVV